MDFYRDQVTQASWETLTRLRKEFKFVLIGGWAVWLYTKQLKSKDIDLVVGLPELGKLKKKYDLVKNERLKKYEARQGETEIDIYVPYYSNLGIPVEEVVRATRSIEGFNLPEPEMLLFLKLVAFQERKLSVKGRKDLIDIVGLLVTPGFDWEKAGEISRQFKLEVLKEELQDLLAKTNEVEELRLNRHRMARLKKEWLKKLKA
jgi:hypothetical protein